MAENGTFFVVGRSPRRTARSPRGLDNVVKLMVLKFDGCEQKAAAEMVAKTGGKDKSNSGCPSFLQMLADNKWAYPVFQQPQKASTAHDLLAATE